jgi:hypothetical protein
MTDTPPKPKRRRWRWVAAGILCVIAIVGWWCWPRNNGPYVGKWKTTTSGISSTMTLKSNGMGFTEVDGSRFDYPYHVEGNRMTIGWNVTPMFSPVAQWLANSWSLMTGHTHVIGVQTIDFIEAGADIIRVHRPATLANQPGPDVVEWQRSSE